MKIFLKGLWIGATMTVPGISGGTMAAVLGLYERLILAMAEWRKNPKENLLFLLQFAIGGGIGFFCFAKIMTDLLEQSGIGFGLRIFFSVIVLGSIPFLVRQSGLQSIRIKDVLEVLTGAVIVYGLSYLPTGFTGIKTDLLSLIFQLLGGIIVAAALILPGISVSHMLYILGLYQPVMEMVYQFKILSLLPLLIGVIVGAVLTTKAVEYFLGKRKQDVYMIIIGFVAASVTSLLAQ